MKTNTKMEKYHGFDQQFYDYLFSYITERGGTRMLVVASDLVAELQDKYDPKDPLNLFRKQYGNIFEALKAIKNPFYILDNMVIRMKKPEQVRKLKIRQDLLNKYEAKLLINKQEEIKVMKINNENQCSACGKVYNINVNKNGMCDKNGKQHQPMH